MGNNNKRHKVPSEGEKEKVRQVALKEAQDRLKADRDKAKADVAAVAQAVANAKPEIVSAEEKQKFLNFIEFYEKVAPLDVKWTYPAAQYIADEKLPKSLTPFALTWYDRFLKVELAAKHFQVFVKSVDDNARKNEFGLFIVIDNRGEIVSPPLLLLKALATGVIDDRVNGPLISRDDNNLFLPTVTVQYPLPIGLEACQIFFVSFHASGGKVLPDDQVFFEGLAKLHAAISSYLKVAREEPSNIERAAKLIDGFTGNAFIDLIPAPFNSAVKSGGQLTAGILGALARKASLVFEFYD